MEAVPGLVETLILIGSDLLRQDRAAEHLHQLAGAVIGFLRD